MDNSWCDGNRSIKVGVLAVIQRLKFIPIRNPVGYLIILKIILRPDNVITHAGDKKADPLIRARLAVAALDEEACVI